MRRRIGSLYLLLALTVVAGCASIPLLGGGKPEFWGFAAPWDPASDATIARHGEQLDVIVSGWIQLDSLTGRPYTRFNDSTARRGNTRRMLMVSTGDENGFRPDPIRSLAAKPEALARAAQIIATTARDGRYAGMVLDFENLSPADLDAQVRTIRAIADSAHAHGIQTVAVAIPAGDTSGYPARPLLAAGVDQLIVMLYDEHWSTSGPGAIASPDWATRMLGMRVAEVGASRLVAGLPTYGYQWRPNVRVAEPIGYTDAVKLAAAAGVTLEREPATQNLRAARAENGANQWEVWVSDAGLVRRLVDDLSRMGVRRFALWRLGHEDPEMWRTVVR